MIGESVLRIEDPALLAGRGQFTDDLNLPHQAHAWFVRSPHAHARITGIDFGEALASSGVLDVVTAADLAEAGIGPLTDRVSHKNQDGSPFINHGRPLLARDRVRYVGDTVAMVVAVSLTQAREAAECIWVDYEELGAVADASAALASDAVQLWDDAPRNLGLDWRGGEAEATAEAFARAAHVTRLRLVNNRIVCAPMETRGALASYEPGIGHYTVITPSQGANAIRDGITSTGLVANAAALRVITPLDIGGAFGVKIATYPEQVLVAFATRRVGRPVKWMAERSDAFLTDHQARDHVTTAELALDEDGRFLAIRTDTISNLGAYATGPAATIPTSGGTRCITGVYAIPTWTARSRLVYTNTAPIHAYRGAGKPEYNYLVERLVDQAARELALDSADLRRRNVVPPSAMPYHTTTGLEFDSGEFARNMDDALALADRAGFSGRRDEARRRNKLRGFGFALFQEPDGFLDNRVNLLFNSDGGLTLTLTGQTGGQGHATVFTQVLADQLGLEPSTIRIIAGDTDAIGPGRGSGGSRTATVAGAGIVLASRKIIEKGKRLAGQLLEASSTDISFAAGRFTVKGTDMAVSIRDVARAAFDPAMTRHEDGLGLEASHHYLAREYNYPCGCNVCEVEIDPDTGQIDLLSYTLVNDHGVVLNPMLLEGQLHGGLAQGIGQALFEHCVYDPDNGQLLTGSFMDYTLPRAGDLPMFEFQFSPVPAKTNVLGVKGVGESGCTGALPTIMNAVVDALAQIGITEVDMPATPERLWRLCAEALAKQRFPTA